MAKHNIKELDAGQLMVRKTGGQPQYANAGDLLIKDLGTYINFVVIAAMRIFLAGGLDVLREHCEV